MFRPLHSRTTAAVGFRSRGAGVVLAGVISSIALGLVGAAAAATFDSYDDRSIGESVLAGDGLSSVVVNDPTAMGVGTATESDGGWMISDGGGAPEAGLDAQANCPYGSGAPCPPWNGMPGLINSHLGDACPRLIWAVDALMLWQGNVASRPLFINPGSGLTALDVNQVNAPVSVGPRVALILNLNQCHGIEANWFQVEPFAGTRPLGAVAAPYAMNNIAGMAFTDIRRASVSETAAFKSFELNWRRRTLSPLTWLAGFRWVEWDQTLDIGDVYRAGNTVGTDTTSVLAGNNLYGGQLGVDALLWNTGNWLTVNGVAKAGAFYNYQAFQRTELLGDRESGTFAAAGNGTAFVGEVGVNGTVQILQWLYWRAGYNFFWLSGLAVPASQLSITNQPATGLNLDGSVFLHGVNTGLEARW